MSNPPLSSRPSTLAGNFLTRRVPLGSADWAPAGDAWACFFSWAHASNIKVNASRVRTALVIFIEDSKEVDNDQAWRASRTKPGIGAYFPRRVRRQLSFVQTRHDSCNKMLMHGSNNTGKHHMKVIQHKNLPSYMIRCDSLFNR